MLTPIQTTNTTNTTNTLNMINEEVLLEELKIVKKKWDSYISKYPEYTIEYNDIESHGLISRIQDRTDLSLNDIGKNIQNAVEYIIMKDNNGFFKKTAMVDIAVVRDTDVAFKILIMINPLTKYIRVSTILAKDMDTKGTINWSLDLKENLQFI